MKFINLPKNDNDIGPILQHAIDSSQGGTIFIPSGNFVLKSQIVIRNGVTLKGEGWKFDPSTFNVYGTVISVQYGKGSVEDKNNAAVIMESATRVEGLSFVYNDQLETLSEPIEYGPTIKFYEDSNGIGEVNPHPYHTCEVRDVFFYKSYCAIDARGSSSRAKGYSQIATCRYENILMSTLKYGIRIDTMNDWNFLNKIEQQPGHMGHYLEIGKSLRDWVQKNCIVFDFSGLIDWIKITDCTAWCCNVGVYAKDASGPVSLIGVELDACRYPILVEGNSKILNIKAIGCTFTAFDTVEQYKNGPNKYSGYVFTLSNNSEIGSISFSNCYLFGPSAGWITGSPSVALITGCVGKDAENVKIENKKKKLNIFQKIFSLFT